MAKLTTRKASGTARSSTQGGKSVTAVRKILADTEPKQRPRRKAWNARKSCGAIAPRMPMGAATVDMGADANTYIGATLMDGSVEPDLVYSPTISTTLNTNKPRQQRRRKEACGGRKSCGGRAPRMPIGFATGNVDIDVNVAATKTISAALATSDPRQCNLLEEESEGEEEGLMADLESANVAGGKPKAHF